MAFDIDSCTCGILEVRVDGMLVLVPAEQRPHRRVLYVNSYGGSALWEKIKTGAAPAQHLWGCLQLVRLGYEVAIAESLPHFCFNRNAIPHDFKLYRPIRDWLGNDGIVYCGHTLLYWIPLLRWMGVVGCPIVSLTYARESLDMARAHAGILALTPAAADEAKKLAPRTKVAHISWGADLGYFPRLPYSPQWFLSCGITNRDFRTLSLASAKCPDNIRVICPGIRDMISWSPNVSVTDGGDGLCVDKKEVSYEALLHDYYAGCSAALIVLRSDPSQRHAVGFTNLIEAFAMARPVIVTRTGALASELDVEKAGCGLCVPAEDPEALGAAIAKLAAEPEQAKAMGAAGRRLCDERYNMERFGADLHGFFETL